MKKILNRLLVWALVLTLTVGLFPTTALAAGNGSLQTVKSSGNSQEAIYINPLYADVISKEDLNKPTENGRLLSNGRLFSSSETAYDYMRECMETRTEDISFSVRVTDVSNSTVRETLQTLCRDVYYLAIEHTGEPTEGDYLRWQTAGWQASWSWYWEDASTVVVTYDYTMTYFTTAQQEAQVTSTVNSLLNSLNVAGKSDYMKLCAVYEWMCTNITYDYYHLETDPDGYLIMYSAYGALIDRTAVCQGYAVLLYRFALEMGIDARLIAGDAGGRHGWNIVKLGNLYYNVDSTWDASWVQAGYGYNYFLRCPSNFDSEHNRDDEYDTTAFHAEYPMSPTDYVPSANDYITITDKVPSKPYKIVNVVSGVHVYWKSVEGATKYGLWRSETGKNGTYKWVANPTTNHFTDTSVTSGKTYYYKVTTMDAYSNTHSDKSEAVGITYVATPDITARYNKAAGIKLEWEKITGAKGYAIYRKTYSGGDDWVRVATISDPTTLTWSDTSVKDENGKIYKYTIRALAGSDLKTLSGCRNAGRTMVRLTSRTLNNAVKTGSTSIKCTWATTSQATGYEVRFMVGNTVYKTFTIGNYKTGTKTFTGLKAGQTYKIQVRSYKKVDGVGSFYSAWSTAKNVGL